MSKREAEEKMDDGYNGLDAVDLCGMCKGSTGQTEVEIHGSQPSGKKKTPTNERTNFFF